MNPYKIDLSKFKESEKILDPKDLIKFKLIAVLLKTISKMENNEVLKITGLDKSDLSRLKALNIKRFSIDRIIILLDKLGLSTKIDVKPKKAS